MRLFRLNPLTVKKLKRFKSIKRGYYSFLFLCFVLLIAAFAEIFVSNRAIIVKYEGEYRFPTYGAVIPGNEFGEDYQYETNYKNLKTKFKGSANWVLLPLVPYDPYEIEAIEGEYPPSAPSLKRSHYLGTDKIGRDIVARILYGFRYAMIFALGLLFFNMIIGIFVGSLMGYYGGWFDIILQRLIEILSNIPYLYVIIIIASIVNPSLGILLGISVLFGWMNLTWYARTAAFKNKAQDFIHAAKILGASDSRIILKHMIPNIISLIVTFIPFQVAGGITLLTSLDYLGFGLLPPTPSWGELLAQGTERLDAPWIGISIVIAMSVILILINFIGEAIRESFDPKKHTIYY